MIAIYFPINLAIISVMHWIRYKDFPAPQEFILPLVILVPGTVLLFRAITWKRKARCILVLGPEGIGWMHPMRRSRRLAWGDLDSLERVGLGRGLRLKTKGGGAIAIPRAFVYKNETIDGLTFSGLRRLIEYQWYRANHQLKPDN
jgi:hypothetical protein